MNRWLRGPGLTPRGFFSEGDLISVSFKEGHIGTGEDRETVLMAKIVGSKASYKKVDFNMTLDLTPRDVEGLDLEYKE